MPWGRLDEVAPLATASPAARGPPGDTLEGTPLNNVATAEEFVRFLVAGGWLMHYLDFSGERMLPSIPALLDQPFWLDPSDRHHMAAVMQAASRQPAHDYTAASGDLRHDQIYNERVWAKAVHRVAADGISPEQAVEGYGQFWGMRSGSGLVLGGGDRLAVAEADTADDVGEAVGTIQSAPVALGRLGELEDHGERGRA